MFDRLRHLFAKPQPEHHCDRRGCDRIATREDHFYKVRTCDDHVPYIRVLSKSRKVTRRRRNGLPPLP